MICDIMFKSGNMLKEVRVEKSDYFPNYFEVWEYDRDMYLVRQDNVAKMYPYPVQDEQYPRYMEKF